MKFCSSLWKSWGWFAVLVVTEKIFHASVGFAVCISSKVDNVNKSIWIQSFLCGLIKWSFIYEHGGGLVTVLALSIAALPAITWFDVYAAIGNPNLLIPKLHPLHVNDYSKIFLCLFPTDIHAASCDLRDADPMTICWLAKCCLIELPHHFPHYLCIQLLTVCWFWLSGCSMLEMRKGNSSLHRFGLKERPEQVMVWPASHSFQ